MPKKFFAHLGVQHRYKAVLCVNGDLPARAFFEQADLPIIALDGAANTLLEMNLRPDLVIGDLDSIKPSYLTQLKTLHMPHQDQSDFQKGLAYLKANNLLPGIILGINGGYLDHILHNINIFQETESICYAPPLVCYALKQTTKFRLALHTKISLMGMPNALVTTQGLKWNLERTILQFPGPSSAFNRTALKEVSIEVHRGTLLAFIYLEEMMDAGLL